MAREKTAAAELAFVPARARRIHGSIAHDLGVAIVTGRYQPGDVLFGEIEFSEQLKVSRGAYREATRMLAAKGLVESRPKTGTRVSPRSRWNLLDPDVLAWMFEGEPSEAFVREQRRAPCEATPPSSPGSTRC